jgi:hypothetical protein
MGMEMSDGDHLECCAASKLGGGLRRTTNILLHLRIKRHYADATFFYRSGVEKVGKVDLGEFL